MQSLPTLGDPLRATTTYRITRTSSTRWGGRFARPSIHQKAGDGRTGYGELGLRWSSRAQPHHPKSSPFPELDPPEFVLFKGKDSRSLERMPPDPNPRSSVSAARHTRAPRRLARPRRPPWTGEETGGEGSSASFAPGLAPGSFPGEAEGVASPPAGLSTAMPGYGIPEHGGGVTTEYSGATIGPRGLAERRGRGGLDLDDDDAQTRRRLGPPGSASSGISGFRTPREASSTPGVAEGDAVEDKAFEGEVEAKEVGSLPCAAPVVDASVDTTGNRPCGRGGSLTPVMEDGGNGDGVIDLEVPGTSEQSGRADGSATGECVECPPRPFVLHCVDRHSVCQLGWHTMGCS